MREERAVSPEAFAARLTNRSVLREMVRLYVATPRDTAESGVRWTALTEQKIPVHLTRADVEVAAVMAGLPLHPSRARHH